MPALSTSSDRFERHPATLWRATSSGPVLLGPADDDPALVRGLAAVVWEVLDRPMAADDLVTAIGELGEDGIAPAAVTEALAALEAAGWARRS